MRSREDPTQRAVKHMKGLLGGMETVGGCCLPCYVHSDRSISWCLAAHMTVPVFNYKHIYWGGMLVKKNFCARKVCKNKREQIWWNIDGNVVKRDNQETGTMMNAMW